MQRQQRKSLSTLEYRMNERVRIPGVWGLEMPQYNNNRGVGTIRGYLKKLIVVVFFVKNVSFTYLRKQ